ncbi:MULTISPECIES: hypothetical protein [unclassified Bacteroides]|uniref:hypothetical protein n=1 Tax=unclassified Bacteroides TaxID=2646097 RepID=UPI004063E542
MLTKEHIRAVIEIGVLLALYIALDFAFPDFVEKHKTIITLVLAGISLLLYYMGKNRRKTD